MRKEEFFAMNSFYPGEAMGSMGREGHSTGRKGSHLYHFEPEPTEMNDNIHKMHKTWVLIHDRTSSVITIHFYGDLMKALVLIFSFLALPLFAHAQDLKACNQKGLSYLKQAIDERLTEGDLTESRYMVNDRNQVVGVYIWNKDGTAIYGEVCEQIDVEDGYMTASSWYYWVNEEYGDGKKSSDPTTWGENYWYYISQDEGQAAFKMISVEANGDIVVDFRVIGYGDTDDEINFRQETLRLVK